MIGFLFQEDGLGFLGGQGGVPQEGLHLWVVGIF